MKTSKKPLIEWPPDEPVEFRIADRQGEIKYVLAYYVGNNGMLGYSLTRPGSSIPHAIDNLQSRGIQPRKAVQGWQFEAFAFADSGLYHIAEVR